MICYCLKTILKNGYHMEQSSLKFIRNFCIVAHVDHGKSTLADRLLEMTGTVQMRDMRSQLLDSNPIERERGITIKLAPVRMTYRMNNVQGTMYNENQNEIIHSSLYILNLIDTPGHVDFNYEVSRSLAACEGAVLVVDATQGVQAQTLANLNLARKQNLTIIPVINKIDLPNAQIAKALGELSSLGFRKEEIIAISAKNGTNVDQVLEAIVSVVPAPNGSTSSPLRALIFSSQYDPHKGVVCYVRVVDGSIIAGPAVSISPQIHPQGDPGFGAPRARVTRLQFIASGVEVDPIEVGYFMPKMLKSRGLETGEVVYIATGLKDVALAKVGDTVTVGDANRKVSQVPQVSPGARGEENEVTNTRGTRGTLDTRDTFVIPLPGYKEPKPMVFLGVFPIESDKVSEVRDALGKLRLSDSAFSYKPISSLALGHGFHCGFLGLLHAEVVQERLSREFGLNLLATAPTVEYRIKLKGSATPPNPLFVRGGEGELGLLKTIQSATEYPDPSTIEQTYEPVMELTIFSPKRYVGAIMQLCQDKRAEFIDLQYIGNTSVIPSEVEGSISSASFKKDPSTRSPSADGSLGRDDNLLKEEQVLTKFSYLIPLSEMIIDFFDRLKSITEGYASLDYEFFDYQPVSVVKLDILLNHVSVDAFSQLIVEERAQSMGRMLVEKLAEVIPRHQFTA